MDYAAQVSPEATELQVKVLYEAETQPNGDYTAFVHLLDGEGNRVSGARSAARGRPFPDPSMATG